MLELIRIIVFSCGASIYEFVQMVMEMCDGRYNFHHILSISSNHSIKALEFTFCDTKPFWEI